MSSGRLKASSSGCVHFMYSDFFDGNIQAAIRGLREQGVRCAYVEYQCVEYSELQFVNAIARQLKLQHVPYPSRTSAFEPEVWIPFSDDLITLSEHEAGMVLFIDKADEFLAKNSRGMLRLIEDFLVQHHHWMEKKKPCHLCFQMEPNNTLRAQFVMG